MANKIPSALDNYPAYELTIGFETHVQLTTKTKIFCACANEIADEPNKNICEICTAQPGSLPVTNRQVIDYAIRAGLALNCTINKHNVFDRKHYFYPDLPKNYQITQNDKPICLGGHVPIRLEDGSIKNVRLTRIHMEEDAGKNIHSDVSSESFVDLNRAGTPLLEIVSEPDVSSTAEARAYLKALHGIVTYLGICTGNMEQGAFRGDTNISVRKKGTEKLGTKVELKNINSFKFITDAIEYEIERQIELLESGVTVRQETRLWDSKEKKTYVMRTKEEAADYRFFADPDLPAIVIDDAWISRVRAELPELPEQRLARYVKLGLSPYEAEIFIGDRDLAAYFEAAYKLHPSKQVVNWILRDVMSYLKEQSLSPEQCKVTPEKLSALVQLLESDKINNHAAKEIFLAVAETGAEPAQIMKERGLEQVGVTPELENLIKELVEKHPNEAAEVKGGNQRIFAFFVGSAMKLTQGKGNPKLIQELLKKYLS